MACLSTNNDVHLLCASEGGIIASRSLIAPKPVTVATATDDNDDDDTGMMGEYRSASIVRAVVAVLNYSSSPNNNDGSNGNNSNTLTTITTLFEIRGVCDTGPGQSCSDDDDDYTTNMPAKASLCDRRTNFDIHASRWGRQTAGSARGVSNDE